MDAPTGYACTSRPNPNYISVLQGGNYISYTDGGTFPDDFVPSVGSSDVFGGPSRVPYRPGGPSTLLPAEIGCFSHPTFAGRSFRPPSRWVPLVGRRAGQWPRSTQPTTLRPSLSVVWRLFGRSRVLTRLKLVVLPYRSPSPPCGGEYSGKYRWTCDHPSNRLDVRPSGRVRAGRVDVCANCRRSHGVGSPE